LGFAVQLPRTYSPAILALQKNSKLCTKIKFISLILYTRIPNPNHAPVLLAGGAEELVGAVVPVDEAALLVAEAVPATVACTIWPKELKIIFTKALSGEYEYCF
jgi:hypothetical protein